MSLIRSCVLCRPGSPYTAAPGWFACHHCADRLAGLLGDLGDRFATLMDADELIPHGSGERGSPGFGPRSPAVDALLVHSDVRTKWTSEHGHGALAAVESWARMIREETGAGVPAGRATMSRELATIRFNWNFVLGAPWLDGFADEIRDVLRSLTMAGRLTERVIRVGPCPVTIDTYVYGMDPVSTTCGATLTVRADADEIRCRSCGCVWPRSQWWQLGDPWTDYAALSEELSVPAATLRWWCRVDGWRTEPSPTSKKRVLVCGMDARASYARRRQGKVA
jgi:hypothetical protein